MAQLFGLTRQQRHVEGVQVDPEARDVGWAKWAGVVLGELVLVGFYALLFYLNRDPLHHGFFVASFYAAAIAWIMPVYFENKIYHLHAGEEWLVHLLHLSSFSFLWFVVVAVMQVRFDQGYAFGKDPFSSKEDERNDFTLACIGIGVFLAFFAISLAWKVAWFAVIVVLVAYMFTNSLHEWAGFGIGVGALLLALVLMYATCSWLALDDSLKGRIMDVSRHIGASFAAVLSGYFVFSDDAPWLTRYIFGRRSDYAVPMVIGAALGVVRLLVDALSFGTMRNYTNGQSMRRAVQQAAAPQQQQQLAKPTTGVRIGATATTGSPEEATGGDGDIEEGYEDRKLLPRSELSTLQNMHPSSSLSSSSSSSPDRTTTKRNRGDRATGRTRTHRRGDHSGEGEEEGGAHASEY